ncbi:MAG TPA: SGNH/GDSL hydrolase family protein [Chitinophaga sp.]|uniref:SGNH/GDSL hydrolase family protein n=1 Tax=Chitinophaga sp. TaxID=1869181 RepID=UPI002DB6BE38|nr:SGNH/GDSL hydrolase family protein [Chitinophaga sp.]HEU4554741.1 SGNH/GDSL hydrolase family protein [Chitinophaga sp.]
MRRKLLLLFMSAIALQAEAQQRPAPFQQGDRVVFVGNSITDGGHYHSYIWLYYMTHFPGRRITCFNAGIGGDVITQIYERFDADVLSKKPTVLTLTWGMNDTGYFEWYRADGKDTMQKKLQRSYDSYAKVEAILKKRSDIKKVFIGTSPYDDAAKFNNKNIFPHKTDALTEVVTFQEQAAKRNGWAFVDFYRPMMAINQREQQKDSTFSLTPNDRIHPDNDGHMVMAYLFLKAQGLAGQPVASMRVDAASKKVQEAANCKITGVTGSASGISFSYLAQSLPYPLDTVPRGWGNHKKQSDAMEIVPFMKEFNQEILQVSGLKAGSYNLLMDGEKVGTYDAGQLAAGINLAENTRTPEYQQAIQVRELNEERWDIERRLRMYAWIEFDFLKPRGMLFKDDNAAMDSVNVYAPKDWAVAGNRDNFSRARYKAVREAWQGEMNVLTDKIYQINQPKLHTITIAAAR